MHYWKRGSWAHGWEGSARPTGESLQREPPLMHLLRLRVRDYTMDKRIIGWLQRLARKAVYVHELFTFCFVSLKAVVQISEGWTCCLQRCSPFGGESCELVHRWSVCITRAWRKCWSVAGAAKWGNKLDRFVTLIWNYPTLLRHEIFLIECKWVLSDVRNL